MHQLIIPFLLLLAGIVIFSCMLHRIDRYSSDIQNQVRAITELMNRDTGTRFMWLQISLPGGRFIRTFNMDINFKGHGTETVKAVFKDADGNITTDHGAVVFTSSDDTIATVVAQADGVTAIVTGTGKIGTATITATDAQDNEVAVATVTTEPGHAVAMELAGEDPVKADPVAASAAAPTGNGDEPGK